MLVLQCSQKAKNVFGNGKCCSSFEKLPDKSQYPGGSANCLTVVLQADRSLSPACISSLPFYFDAYSDNRNAAVSVGGELAITVIVIKIRFS